MRPVAALFVSFWLLCSPAPAAGQSGPQPSLGARAFVTFERTSMDASSTFKAITGSSSFFGLGGGGEVLNVWRNVFARVGVSTTAQTGERAFLVGGALISTGVPIEIRVTTVEISAGWRNSPKRYPKVAYYGGAGLLATRFSEASSFAEPGDDSTGTFRGYTLFAGVDAAVSKFVLVGAEVQFRAVPDAIGDGGLSQAYGERSLGGFAVRAMVGVRVK